MRIKSYQSLPIQFITHHMGLFVCIYDICMYTHTHTHICLYTHTYRWLESNACALEAKEL